MRGLTAQMRIGAMADLVSFRTPTYARDGYGGIVPDINGVTQPQYRAEVTVQQGKEAPADTPQDKVTKIIMIKMRSRGTSDPVQHDIATWKGDEYDIIDITTTQRDRFISITARLITTGT